MVRNLDRMGVVCIAGVLALVGTAQAQVVDAPGPVQPLTPRPAAVIPEDAPKLVFERTIHDFGRVHDVEDMKATFKFRNAGKTTLVMEKPKAKCGCTVPDLEKLEWGPGEEGELTVIFHPQGKHGPQSQPITITSNDPAEPARNIFVEAVVRHLVHVDPPLLQFGPVGKGESKSMVVRVSGSNEGFKAWYATANNRERFSAKVLTTSETVVDGETMFTSEVEVTVKAGDTLGELGGDLTIRTNEPLQRLSAVKMTATVVGDLRVVPEKLSLGMLMTSSSFERVIKVTSRNGKAFEIVGVRGNSNLPEALTFDVVPVDPAKKDAYEIVMKGKTPDGALPARGVILITTNVPDQREIRVAFYGVVQAEGSPAGTIPEGFETGDEDTRAGGGGG